MQRELDIALELARTAGAEVVRLRDGELAVEMKPGDEPVTVADRRASELIVAGLAAAFPDDPVISEELLPTPLANGAEDPAPLASVTRGGSPRLWLVDPIDGTKDFIRGSDGFSVMIGLVEHGRPVLGVVYQPAIDRMFYASPAGAFGQTPDGTRPLTVSALTTATDARLVASASSRSPDDIDRVKRALRASTTNTTSAPSASSCR